MNDLFIGKYVITKSSNGFMCSCVDDMGNDYYIEDAEGNNTFDYYYEVVMALMHKLTTNKVEYHGTNE